MGYPVTFLVLGTSVRVVMSLIKSASSCFQGITRTTRRLLRQQTSGHHAQVTNAWRFWQASGHHPRTSDQATGYSCDQHRTCVRCTLNRFDKQTLTTDRATPLFPTRGKHQTGTHTHRLTARQLCRSTNAASNFRLRLQFAPVFPALHAISSRPIQSFLLPTVSLNNSVVS